MSTPPRRFISLTPLPLPMITFFRATYPRTIRCIAAADRKSLDLVISLKT